MALSGGHEAAFPLRFRRLPHLVERRVADVADGPGAVCRAVEDLALGAHHDVALARGAPQEEREAPGVAPIFLKIAPVEKFGPEPRMPASIRRVDPGDRVLRGANVLGDAADAAQAV